MSQETVLMFGIFDMLHVGHVRALKQAASLGDSLVVGLPSDAVVAEDKGKLPIIEMQYRVEMIGSLACVSEVVTYYEFEFLAALNYVKPDILAVSTTWGREKRHLDAERWMAEHDGKVVVIPYFDGESTTKIKQRVVDQWRQ